MESILLVRYFYFWGGIVFFSSILFCVGLKKTVTEDYELH